ncbi:MAG TPA: Fe2+-dependent dioxygenase [Rhizomicrobium sp.]|jgi:PKHD-type hydroxylase|nr:Fe2+-dependent dioxygenase [Rhizomicrobium sp.]
MFLVAKNVLTPAEVEQIRTIAKSVRFMEGRASNPHNIAKDNLQMDVTQPDALRASNIAGAAIMRSEEIKNFVFPRRVATPLLARYEPGMKYGVHSDAAFIPLPNGPLRSDMSGTLWIADPSTYEGGELTIHLGSETVSVKGEPGSMVVYPSTTLHEVTPITKGQRLVLITFIESTIVDQADRELLWQLNEIYALEGLKMDWENRTRLQYVISSLHRKWAD